MVLPCVGMLAIDGVLHRLNRLNGCPAKLCVRQKNQTNGRTLNIMRAMRKFPLTIDELPQQFGLK
jgi:hypothetical protein